MPRGRWIGVLVVFAGMAGLIPAMASPITIGSLQKRDLGRAGAVGKHYGAEWR